VVYDYEFTRKDSELAEATKFIDLTIGLFICFVPLYEANMLVKLKKRLPFPMIVRKWGALFRNV
jgi:hypothetical protein